MAQYQHLPIYKTAYDLLQIVTRLSKGFSRDFKYSLGDKLRNECVDLVVHIFRANSVQAERLQHARAIVERVQVVELLMRLCRDMRLISIEQFSEAVTATDSIARQAQGWIKSSQALADSRSLR